MRFGTIISMLISEICLNILLSGLYNDQLINDLSNMQVCCTFGILIYNIIAYVEYLVVLAPSALTLRVLINAANKSAHDINLNFALDMTNCMFFYVNKILRLNSILKLMIKLPKS